MNEVIHFGAELLRLNNSQLREMEALPRLYLIKRCLYMSDHFMLVSIPGHHTRDNALEEPPVPRSLIPA